MIPWANHLWQSTLFAIAAYALTLALREHRARVRYWIWLAASVKFLIPFSILTSLGSTSVPSAPLPVAVRAARESAASLAAPVSVLPIPDTPSGTVFLWAVPAIWLAGCLAIAAAWLIRWNRLRVLAAGANPSAVSAPVPVYETDSAIEPGVFGVVRPVLLLPAGIGERLTPEQLDAIIEHESCHVRGRDNLTAAIHLAVQAVFWFHPLVWWIGARLIAEREKACDEEVLVSGSSPRVYAEAITSVCRFYFESPLACAAGVTGSDLHRRIRDIMGARVARPLGRWARVALASAAVSAVAIPVLTGFAQNEPDKLRFEVASIRESKADHDNSRIGPAPGGGLQAVNARLLNLITFAHGVQEFQITGTPGWVQPARYDILAKSPEPEKPLEKPSIMELRARIDGHRERTRILLAERFQLQVHRESKEMPVYGMTIAKGGHKLKEARDGENPPNIRNGRGKLTARNIPIRDAARSLAQYLGREVIDETGLSGVYDFELNWAPDSSPDDLGPSLFTALQEQLGLKLESKRAPVDVLVVDRIERPSPN